MKAPLVHLCLIQVRIPGCKCMNYPQFENYNCLEIGSYLSVHCMTTYS